MAEDYIVEQGDCLSSIAFERGFLPETIWGHSNNSDLKQQRVNPNVLNAGDSLYIPDLTLKQESGATETRHQFQLKGTPVKLRLRITQPPPPKTAAPNQAPQPGQGQNQAATPAASDQPSAGQETQKDPPVANLNYTLHIGGKVIEGVTDGDGMIECGIPPGAREALLVLDPGTPNEWPLPLKLGFLDPVEEPTGVQARLNNLGFHCGEVDGNPGPRTTGALKAFQTQMGLPATGDLDETTRNKLREEHDSV